MNPLSAIKLLLLIYISLLAFVSYRSKSSEKLQKNSQTNFEIAGPTSTSIDESITIANQKRFSVALLVVFVGDSLPIWINAFLLSAINSQNDTIFTWYIFLVHNQTTQHTQQIDTFGNIRIVHISKSELYYRLSTLYESSIPISFFEKAFDSWSYSLVEYKPCFGKLFEDYIHNYTHWGYADIDLLPGNLDKFVNFDILEKFDIYTSSFGDQNRLYLRGQLTLLKRGKQTLNLWQQCDRLYGMKIRIMNFISYLSKYPKARWPFESAEGCFSKAAIFSNLTIYFDVSQFSDAFHGFPNKREALVYPNKVERCFYLTHPTADLTQHQLNIANKKRFKVGPFVKSCSYWINPKYQV